MPEPLIRLIHAVTGPSSGVPDAELLARTATRDEAAFELLVRRYAELVWTVCRATAGNHHAAEDAFQAAFLALALALKAGSVRENLPGWLHRVAYHAGLKARKASGPRERAGVPPVTADAGRSPGGSHRPADAGRSPDEYAALHDELARLPAKYREPLVLCYLHGLTQAEAAARLGVPVGTVATRIRRGGDRLRCRLVRRGVTAAVPLSALSVSPELIAAAVRAAAARPEPILLLTHGALAAMTSIKPKLIAGLAMCVGVGGLTLTFAQGPGGPPGGTPQAGGAPGGTGAGVSGGFAPPPMRVRPEVPFVLEIGVGDRVADAQQRARSTDNLKRIMQAMHNFVDLHERFPTGTRDELGRLTLSWRVELLPFLGPKEAALFERFDPDEPFDGPTNALLLREMPDVYRTGIESTASTETLYQMFWGGEALCDHAVPVPLLAVTDGTSNTLAVVEAGPRVPWTKPADLPFTVRSPMRPIQLPFKNVWHAAFADGSVAYLKTDPDPLTLRAAITRNGGEVFDMDKLMAKVAPTSDAERAAARKLAAAADELRATVDALRAERDKLRKSEPDVRELEQRVQGLKAEAEALRQEIEALKRSGVVK